ncbi:hypothetical protein M9Y10_027508 [Tritrichomonas musculus]|uniref:Myb-like DNA-binding domain containing protein n=1 Tax=Tritrichomonas musculus TaxID=1915356 RepID=A0ABR2H566_9EUKA
METQLQTNYKNEIPKQTISTLRKRFTEEEDNLLKHVIQELHIHNWSEVARYLPGRTARQCRDRYNSYLFKEISNKPWTDEEDAIILSQYPIYGTHWVKISKFLVGRSGNNVKNRWYKYLSKRYSDYISKQDIYILSNKQHLSKHNKTSQNAQQPPQIQLSNDSNQQRQMPVTVKNCIKQNSEPDISSSEFYLNFFNDSFEWELFPSNSDITDSSNCFF